MFPKPALLLPRPASLLPRPVLLLQVPTLGRFQVSHMGDLTQPQHKYAGTGQTWNMEITVIYYVVNNFGL